MPGKAQSAHLRSPGRPGEVSPRVPIARRSAWRQSGAKAHILPQEALQKWRRLHPNVTKLQGRSNSPAPVPSQESRPDRPAAYRQGGEEGHCGLSYSEAAGRGQDTRPRGVVIPPSRRHYLYSWAWRRRRRPRGVSDCYPGGGGGGGDSFQRREGRRVGPRSIKQAPEAGSRARQPRDLVLPRSVCAHARPQQMASRLLALLGPAFQRQRGPPCRSITQA